MSLHTHTDTIDETNRVVASDVMSDRTYLHMHEFDIIILLFSSRYCLFFLFRDLSRACALLCVF